MKRYLILFAIFISISLISTELSESSRRKKKFRKVVSPIGEDVPYPETTTKPQACIAKPKCIPRPICEPKVKCRPRPVQLPACEELPTDTTTEPVEEDIVKITKTELPYCEYRRYCAPKPEVPYCKETITQVPPEIVPPKIIKCGLLSICCWEGYNLLPKSFWLNEDLEEGKDFITIGNDGKYLSSNDEGKITISSSIGKSELFRVTQVATGIVHIMSYYGGYLTINEDGTVDAKSRTICDENFIKILYSKNNCKSDEINYIALRAINGKYLTILEDEAASVDKIKATTELFKGHLFDEKSSNCYGKEPDVDTTPDKTEDKDDKDDKDDGLVTQTPDETTIPKKCLDLTDKILSIECKVIMEKIKEKALKALTKGKGKGRGRDYGYGASSKGSNGSSRSRYYGGYGYYGRGSSEERSKGYGRYLSYA